MFKWIGFKENIRFNKMEKFRENYVDCVTITETFYLSVTDHTTVFAFLSSSVCIFLLIIDAVRLATCHYSAR